MFGALYYYLNRASRGLPLPRIRHIVALDGIEEGIGRSIETGEPVHFSFGVTGADLYKEFAGETLAALGILTYTARLTAKLGARLIFHLPEQAEGAPLLETTLLDAYKMEGQPDAFDTERDIRFYGRGTRVVTSGMIASILSEGCGLLTMVGRQWTTIYPVLEAAQTQGAIVVGGNSRWTSMYIFAFTCDYLFIGEEIFAAGAVVTGNEEMISTVASEEIGKYFSLAVIAIGFILALLGINISNWMKF
jgi:hypothetical protein